ncbi:MAG: FMN-binding protein [Christensenellales bacterium]
MTGFGPFKIAIELDDTGKIVSVTVPENNETPGLGADLLPIRVCLTRWWVRISRRLRSM